VTVAHRQPDFNPSLPHADASCQFHCGRNSSSTMPSSSLSERRITTNRDLTARGGLCSSLRYIPE